MVSPNRSPWPHPRAGEEKTGVRRLSPSWAEHHARANVRLSGGELLGSPPHRLRVRSVTGRYSRYSVALFPSPWPPRRRPPPPDAADASVTAPATGQAVDRADTPRSARPTDPAPGHR